MKLKCLWNSRLRIQTNLYYIMSPVMLPKTPHVWVPRKLQAISSSPNTKKPRPLLPSALDLQ
uniref:Uncharacterized protein n=1 Tax=Anguilla anguilla TaxID=7936 RepID=A0A0E9W7L9_ANGAN